MSLNDSLFGEEDLRWEEYYLLLQSQKKQKTSLYKVPLEVDKNELCHFVIAERHNTYIEASHDPCQVWVIGTQDHLASFFREIDGPGQSFPISEFVEFIQDYKLEA